MQLPIVAIVGRPNVGKSTLFNRLARTKEAIVDDRPGITRDRLYRPCTWNGVEFILVDTGGLHVGTDDVLATKVTEQAQIAMDQADVIVFMLDAKVGAIEDDSRILRALKKSTKTVIIAPNKVDDPKDEASASEYYSLGFKLMLPISAANGLNCGDLLDMVVEHIPKIEAEEVTDDIKLAIVGRPNVGKSSLTNMLTGSNISIVADLPGTTRDAIDTRFEMNGKKYLLIDTAGLRKSNIPKSNIEFYTTLRSIRALSRSDIAIIVVDSIDGLVTGDLRVASEAAEMLKGLIFVFNKWDAVEKDEFTADKLRKAVSKRAPLLAYVPILFISALSGQRVHKIWEAVEMVVEERAKRIKTAELNEFIGALVDKKPPPSRKGKFIKIFYTTQAQGNPPTFLFFCNHPKLVEKPYIRYLENNIRENYGFIGAPIKMVFKLRK